MRERARAAGGVCSHVFAHGVHAHVLITSRYARSLSCYCVGPLADACCTAVLCAIQLTMVMVVQTPSVCGVTNSCLMPYAQGCDLSCTYSNVIVHDRSPLGRLGRAVFSIYDFLPHCAVLVCAVPCCAVVFADQYPRLAAVVDGIGALETSLGV